MDRLEYLLTLIEKYKNDESGFKVLYKELINELHTQRAIDSDRRTNSYLNNLEQTWSKELMHYVACRFKNEENQAFAWKSFLNNFEHDIQDILSKIKN